MGALSRAEAKRTATNTIAQLGVAGWDIFIDAEIEASVRSWLPHDPSLLNNGSKLLKDQLAGILMLQLSDDGAVTCMLCSLEVVYRV